MPPRYAYWTILIDRKPTAFRARERDELLPTLNQLRRKNPDVVLKWFTRGTLWDSPAAAQAALHAPRPAAERRGRDWRPGGEHRDPRDRFKKPKGPVHRPHTTTPRNDNDKKPFAGRPPDRRGPKPFQSRSKGPRDRALPFSPRGQSDGARKPSGPRSSHPPKPWQRDKPWRSPAPPAAKTRKPPEDE